MHQPWRDLVNTDDDAISLLREWVSASSLEVEVLPVSHDEGGRTLEALQVTTRSPLGAVAFHTGGLLIDRGWLRVLGAGHERLPRSLDGWNNLAGEHRCVSPTMCWVGSSRGSASPERSTSWPPTPSSGKTWGSATPTGSSGA